MISDQANQLRDMVRRHDARRNGEGHGPSGTASTASTASPEHPRAEHGRAASVPPRRMMPRRPIHRARSIAVTSGKGGVGKTTVSVNLAVALARLGQRVVLLDADLGTANADVLLNLPATRGLADVVAGRIGIEEALVAAPGGFHLIPGASGLAGVADMDESQRQRLLRQLSLLGGDHDTLLIDTGAGVSANVLGFVAAADEVIVVTTPEPTAITDAYAVIKTASRLRADLTVRLLVNMAEDRGEAEDVAARLAAVCQRFLGLTPTLLDHLPRDPQVSVAVRERRPLLLPRGHSPAARGVERVAAALVSHTAADRPRPSGLGGLLARLIGRG